MLLRLPRHIERYCEQHTEPNAAQSPHFHCCCSASNQPKRQEMPRFTDMTFANKQILLTIMSGAFGLAGWHFSRNPTSSSSENPVAIAVDSEPWKTGGDAKYQYHPGGDTSKPRKDAPSALNEVIVPNVNLPRVSSQLAESTQSSVIANTLTRSFTRSTTSGARTATRQPNNGLQFCIDTLTRSPTFLPSLANSRFYDLFTLEVHETCLGSLRQLS
jgi:hypothetical protein